MKVKSWHVIGGVFVIGLIIYFYTKRTASGTVTADESDATITYVPGQKVTLKAGINPILNNSVNPSDRAGTVAFGSEYH